MTSIIVPGEELERFSPPNRRESMLESLRKMGSLATRATVGENKGKVRLRSTQELREMLKNKNSPRSSDQAAIREEEEDDENGSQGSDDFVGMVNGKRPWRRFSNGPAKGGDGSMRLRSKSDEGLPLIRATLLDAEYNGASTRRLRSRRRRKYAQDNGIEINEEEEDDNAEVDPDIHAGRVRRGSILIPAGMAKMQPRNRRRGGSQDLLIEESVEDDELDAENDNRRGRSKLLIDTVRKNDQETRRRRPRSRRSSMMEKSISEPEQGKLHPPRGRFLSLPGSSRRARRGSVSDVEDDEDDDGLGKMGKRGGFLSTGPSSEAAKASKEELRKKNRVSYTKKK